MQITAIHDFGVRGRSEKLLLHAGRWLGFVLISVAMVSQIACASTAEPQSATTQTAAKPRALIVYLSRTGNTRAVADIIHEKIGGDLVAVELVTPYPGDYRTTVAQVDKENETGYLPPLKTRIENLSDYTTVFIGFPTWDMQLPPPMKSFLKNHDLRGKTVIPFNTNGGYGSGSSFRDVRDLCPGSTVLDGISVEGGLERDGVMLAIRGERRNEVDREVTRWLQSIRMLDGGSR